MPEVNAMRGVASQVDRPGAQRYAKYDDSHRQRVSYRTTYLHGSERECAKDQNTSGQTARQLSSKFGHIEPAQDEAIYGRRNKYGCQGPAAITPHRNP